MSTNKITPEQIADSINQAAAWKRMTLYAILNPTNSCAMTDRL
ncbi:hypothetical protein [Pseudomonas sp. GV071]|jgi:hypothetical protein|nr:hypothetical protein [Pseudomonas sp. GV071]